MIVCYLVFHVSRPESEQPDGPFHSPFCLALIPDGHESTAGFV